jgi:hypothetical protein
MRARVVKRGEREADGFESEKDSFGDVEEESGGSLDAWEITRRVE